MAKILHPPAGPANVEDEDLSLDVTGLLHALLRRWWLILLLAAAAGAAMWQLTRNTPTLYQSAAVIQIETQEQKAIELRDTSQDNLQNPEVVETIIAKFRSRALMQLVNQALGLATDAQFLGPEVVRPASDDLVVARLLNGSQATLRLRTRLVDVTFVHPDPEIARKVANSLVDEFLKQGTDQREGTLADQNRVLISKSQELRQKVDQSERKLQEYKQTTVNSVSIDDRRNLVEAKLKGMNGDLTNAKSERLRLESDAEQARRAKGSTEQLLAITSIAQDARVVEARARLEREEENMAALTQRYGPLHPRMIEVKSQLDAARQDVAAAVLSAPGRIESSEVAARGREDSLQRAVREQETDLLEMDAKAIEFHALQREYDSDRTLFESVLQQLKESTLRLGVQAVEFRVVEPAQKARPAPNRRPLFIFAAALMGAGLTAGALAALFFLNRPVSSVHSAEESLALPVFASVPRMRAIKGPSEAAAAMLRPGSPEAESFRTLRTNLQLLANGTRQVVLVTSAVPGEGKSMTAANAAVAFAQLGLRTLLIEADLRRPSLDQLFLLEGQKATGLGDYLQGQPLNIVDTAKEHLFLLPAGTPLDNPAEMLAGPRFAELISDLRNTYDRIVIDTAPVNVVSDTLNIAACATAVCLVVRSHSTPLKLVRRAVELLKRSGVRPDGLILNWTLGRTSRKFQEYYKGQSAYGSNKTRREAPAAPSAPVTPA